MGAAESGMIPADVQKYGIGSFMTKVERTRQLIRMSDSEEEKEIFAKTFFNGATNWFPYARDPYEQLFLGVERLEAVFGIDPMLVQPLLDTSVRVNGKWLFLMLRALEDQIQTNWGSLQDTEIVQRVSGETNGFERGVGSSIYK
jgi:phage terminase large subunit-like protein